MFLPPYDTGSIYEAFSKQKWVESSTIAANHKICFFCFVEGGFKGKHFLADLVSLPSAAVVRFQKSRWVLKQVDVNFPSVSLRRALWACATMSWDWEHNLEGIGWSPLACQQGPLWYKSLQMYFFFSIILSPPDIKVYKYISLLIGLPTRPPASDLKVYKYISTMQE